MTPSSFSDAAFRSFLEAANDALVVLDPYSGRVLAANPAADRLYGLYPGELTGRDMLALVEDAAAARRRLLDIRHEGAARFEARHRRADGTWRTLDVSASACATPDGMVIVGIHRDVTDRVQAERSAGDSDARFRDMLGSMRMAAVLLDADGRVSFCNAYLLQISGYERDDVMHQDWFARFVPADARDAEREAFHARLRTGNVPRHERRELVDRYGDRRTIGWNHTLMRDADGTTLGLASIGEDVTERALAEAALRESEERYAIAAMGSNDGLWDWDLRQDRVYYSPRWKSMLGFLETEVADGPEEWFDRVHRDELQLVRKELAEHLDGRALQFRAEFRMRHRDGTWRWMLARGIAVRNGAQAPHRMAGSLTDIEDHKAAERQIRHDALHDALTGLPNRTLFLERLGRALARRRNGAGAQAVLGIDLDRFKIVNDSLGHATGDMLLVEVARRLREALAPEDTLARLGGDEFCVLLEDAGDADDAMRVAQRLRHRLARPFVVAGHELHVACSVGIAMTSPEHTRPEDVLREADTATYRAKAVGRACHVLFQPSMHARAVALMQMEAGLRRALAADELAVAFQPIVSIASGRVEGFEALARWPRAGMAPVSPAEFIPVAEDTGLIVPLGRFMLTQACRQVRLWQDAFPSLAPLGISVNLSVRQIQLDDIVSLVRNVLDDTGLPAELLTLEVTESMLAEDPRVTQTLLSLRDLRVRTSIDDFGTGYSSFSQLRRLPIDALKIDKSFVDELVHEGEDRGTIVRTIVDLARGLGMKVVAEGVETDVQLGRLREMHCASAQGYLLSRPLFAADMERFLAERAT